MLERDDIVKTDDHICGRNVSRRAYSELGSVDRSTCCCFVNAETSFGPISPGWGCHSHQVDEIVVELKDRMRMRGDTAQLNMVRRTLERLDAMDRKLVRICKTKFQ